MKRIFFSALCMLAVSCVYAQVWYVSGTGSDSNDGKTLQTAFRSLQKAGDLVQPGDVVRIANGIYTNEDRGNGSSVLSITRSGKPDAWITWEAVSGHKPEIRPLGWGGITISGSYHILDGLTVVGANESIALIRALEDAKKETPDPFYNTNGIFINGRLNKPNEKPHHITIRNCTVCKCPGGGITAIEMDYVTVEDCEVYDNAWFMRYAGSGITTLNNWAFDDAPGYHIIIQRNFVWNNKTLVPWTKINKLSDGNGILLDVTNYGDDGANNPNADAAVSQHTSKPATASASNAVNINPAGRPVWRNRALIANNVSMYNGGSGIHTFRTSHVDIINNTTYWNGGSVDYEELFPNRSKDIVILNNVIVPRPGGRVTSNNRNENIRWDYNIYPVAQHVIVGPNDIVAELQFVTVRKDPTEGNFRLKKGSPAINSGTDDVAQPTDILGKKRPKGAGRDRGAFEQ